MIKVAWWWGNLRERWVLSYHLGKHAAQSHLQQPVWVAWGYRSMANPYVNRYEKAPEEKGT